MKKYILSGAFIIAFVAYVGYHQKNGSAQPLPTTDNSTSSGSGETSAPSESTNPGAGNGKTPSPTPAPTSTGLKDGSYTGSVVDAYYGNIQVKAVISGGKLTDVVFLQYPNDRQQSVEINSAALPQLRSEAISAQSANVNVVSGATQTSEAFFKSLASALSQA
jgi:uncharacterized protein with FMN-binding domain